MKITRELFFERAALSFRKHLPFSATVLIALSGLLAWSSASSSIGNCRGALELASLRETVGLGSEDPFFLARYPGKRLQTSEGPSIDFLEIDSNHPYIDPLSIYHPYYLGEGNDGIVYRFIREPSDPEELSQMERFLGGSYDHKPTGPESFLLKQYHSKDNFKEALSLYAGMKSIFFDRFQIPGFRFLWPEKIRGEPLSLAFEDFKAATLEDVLKSRYIPKPLKDFLIDRYQGLVQSMEDYLRAKFPTMTYFDRYTLSINEDGDIVNDLVLIPPPRSPLEAGKSHYHLMRYRAFVEYRALGEGLDTFLPGLTVLEVLSDGSAETAYLLDPERILVHPNTLEFVQLDPT